MRGVADGEIAEIIPRLRRVREREYGRYQRDFRRQILSVVRRRAAGRVHGRNRVRGGCGNVCAGESGNTRKIVRTGDGGVFCGRRGYGDRRVFGRRIDDGDGGEAVQTRVRGGAE